MQHANDVLCDFNKVSLILNVMAVLRVVVSGLDIRGQSKNSNIASFMFVCKSRIRVQGV